MLQTVLESIHQERLLNGLSEQQQANLYQDLSNFANYYHGGIQAYIENVKRLLQHNDVTNEYVAVEVGLMDEVLVVDSDRKRYCSWK